MADEVKLPTEEDIAKLPRWARVAFAARCARRVLPLMERFWKNAPEHHLEALDRVVSVAETAAANADYAVARAGDADYAARAANVAYAVPADYVARAAARAAHAAIAAAAAYAADTTVYATDAARDAADADKRAVQAIARDFTTLLNAARVEEWTDNTPVPPSVFGPLENETQSDDVPPKVEIPSYTKIAIKALIKPGLPPEAVREGLIELYRAMNDYHMAHGAGVLSLEDFRRFVRAEVAVEV
jgi:hypothetical protein